MTRQPNETLFAQHLADISQRTAVALQRSRLDGLIVHAGETVGLFLDDQHYPFKPHPPFKWWAPLLDAPGSLVHFSPGRRPTLVFRVERGFWYSPAALPEADWPAAFEVVIVHSLAEARAALPADLSRTAWIGDPRPELLQWGVAAINPPELLRRLDFARAVKTPYEIAALADANRLAARGHRAAAQRFLEGGSEFEIHQAFLESCGQREHELPYNAIVAINEAAAVLHYQVLRRVRPSEPKTLLLDAGASVAGYGSDITRTTAKAPGIFADLIDSMDRLQRGLCDLAAPGVDWRDIHAAAVHRIAALLCESGLLRCGVEEAVESGAARLFFPHGIGHLLGLQVHDVGGTMADEEGGTVPKPAQDPALRLTRRLEPGFVVTMEPGLYFIEALLQPARRSDHATRVDWSRVDELAPWGGIRIEDNLVITPSGHANLTRPAFVSAAALP